MVISELLQHQQELYDDIDDLYILHMKILLEYDILSSDGQLHKIIEVNILVGVHKLQTIAQKLFMLSGQLTHIRLDIMQMDE